MKRLTKEQILMVVDDDAFDVVVERVVVLFIVSDIGTYTELYQLL